MNGIYLKIHSVYSSAIKCFFLNFSDGEVIPMSWFRRGSDGIHGGEQSTEVV